MLILLCGDAAVCPCMEGGREGVMARFCELLVFPPDVAKSTDRKGKSSDIDGQLVVLNGQATDDFLECGYVVITVRAFCFSFCSSAKDVEGRPAQ